MRAQGSPYLFGPAGWSYRDWEGTVYPGKKPKAFNHLMFLAGEFDFVEVNTSFYHIPSRQLTTGWVKKTEAVPGFSFWVKLHQGITHQRQASRDEINLFKAALTPLQEVGRLSGLLAQFPYSFKLNTGHLKYVLAVAQAFAGYRLAIEFRDNSWNREELFAVFREHGLIWVNIDQPQVSLNLPLTSVMTHPEVTYFRLHGRNDKTWFAEEGRDARYNYDYNSHELDEIGQKINQLVDLAKKIFISGNNHYKGSAVKNLVALKRLLLGEQQDTRSTPRNDSHKGKD